MNNMQTAAIARVRSYLEAEMNYKGCTFPYVITEFEVREEDIGCRRPFISVMAQRQQGTPGTMLHALGHEFWLFFIGERGKVTIKMSPHYIQNSSRCGPWAHRFHVEVK